jgi:hypothetical protein
LLDIAIQLEPDFYDDFRLELMACNKDCQYAIAMSDLAIILDDDTSFFSIWIGGRHRPFRGQITPRHWTLSKISEPQDLLKKVCHIHDAWDSLAMDDETLPELMVRMGAGRFERYLALGDTSNPRRKSRTSATLIEGVVKND